MAKAQFLPPDPVGESGLNLRPDDSVRLSGDLSSTTEEGVFGSLFESLRDVFFPQKLPPLQLTSKPIAVPDRMAVKRDPKSTILAAVINGLVLAFLLWWGARKVGIIAAPAPKVISLVEPPPPPPKAPPKAVVMGGGGGQKGPTPVTRGNPPKFDPKPILPPMAPPKIEPKLAVDPAINVQKDIKMAKSDLPNIGMPNSPLVGMSMGNGNGSGLGSGNGNGMGPGSGGNTGGGVFRIGGGVSAPQILYQPEPEFSEEARKAKVAGNVLVYLQVNTDGRPMHVRVIRGIGLGLDEKAMEAVKQYKFRPAMKDGKPVIVEMNVEVNFQIF
ncbi:TonB family protein [Granulicella sp. WH15]|uniref:energy transducer TonB n=1 Tax=Granulicella sp. WH15 TaxID=2602070 RepID=UPI0013675A33|nr:energy transducer TonB [Granulicella sp. WH15]QHN04084.1 TonB family protein [Granulicella sp. WH15]